MLKNSTVGASTLLLALLVCFNAPHFTRALAVVENGAMPMDQELSQVFSSEDGEADRSDAEEPSGDDAGQEGASRADRTDIGQGVTVIGYEEELLPIGFSTVRIPSDSLPYKQEKTISQGQEGVMLCRYEISLYPDGSTRRILVEKAVQREASDRVILYGDCKEVPFNKFIYPTSGALTSGYGYRTLNGVRGFHYGIDIASVKGTSVVASDSGRVVLADECSSYGKYVIVDHGNGFSTCYAHLSKICVSEGDAVVRGEELGKMGSTGRVTGVHLHFEIRLDGVKADPLLYLSDELKKA